MRSEVLTYEADGLSMQSHLYYEAGSSGPRPGILVFPEAFGLGDHAKSRAERLAKFGYVTLACDLHGNGKTYKDMAEIGPVIGPLMTAPDRLRARARGGLTALRTRKEADAAKIAAIGYCMGGTMSFELARSGADIKGAVGFHSGLATTAPADAASLKAKILACIGADDPGIPPEQRAAFEAEMRAAKAGWQLHLYGGVVHSFTNPEADALNQPDFLRYDATADARSWAALLAFLTEIFGPGRITRPAASQSA